MAASANSSQLKLSLLPGWEAPPSKV